MVALGLGGRVFPLPQLASLSRSVRPVSRRSQQRVSKARKVTQVANGAIRALNVLHGGMSTSRFAHPSHSSLPEVSIRAVESISGSARRYVSRVAPHLGGLSDDTFLPSSLLVPSYAGGDEAVRLESSAVSLPSSPGGCDFLEFLPDDMVSLYATPNPALFDAPPSPPSPSAFLVSSDEDWLSLVRRMYKLNMLSFTLSPKCVNGAFALPKEGGKQRFLFDGRPINSRMCPPPELALCTPDYLSRLEVPEGERLYVFKEDVDNYFHRLRVPVWMRPYFALPPDRKSVV